MPQPPQTAGERGAASMLGVLGVVAVLGTVVAMGANRIKDLFSLSSHKALTLELQQIRRAVEDNLSCAKTFDATVNPGFNPDTCNESTLVALKRPAAGGTWTTLVSNVQAQPTTIGRYTLRARCAVTGAEIGMIIEAARLKPGVGSPLSTTASANFLKDPLTGKVQTWSSASELFPADARPCRHWLAQHLSWGGSSGRPPYRVPYAFPYAPRCPSDRVNMYAAVHNFGAAAVQITFNGKQRLMFGNGACFENLNAHNLPGTIIGTAAMYATSPGVTPWGTGFNLPPGGFVRYIAGAQWAGIGDFTGELNITGKPASVAATATVVDSQDNNPVLPALQSVGTYPIKKTWNF